MLIRVPETARARKHDVALFTGPQAYIPGKRLLSLDRPVNVQPSCVTFFQINYVVLWVRCGKVRNANPKPAGPRAAVPIGPHNDRHIVVFLGSPMHAFPVEKAIPIKDWDRARKDIGSVSEFQMCGTNTARAPVYKEVRAEKITLQRLQGV